MEIWLALIGGGVGAALVSAIGQILLAKQAHKYSLSREESEGLKALRDGMKWLLFDRIRHVGLAYVEKGAIDFDERRVLRKMHSVYHDALGGNGDLDKLMQEVDALPVKR